MIREHLKALIQLAASDNVIAEKEARLIFKIGEANGIKRDEIREMINKPEPLAEHVKLDNDQKFEYLYNAIQLMTADGQIFKAELEFARDVAERLGYKPEVIDELTTRVFSDVDPTSRKERMKSKASEFLVA